MRRIEIDLKGGLIQNIRNIPEGYEILVRDYDVEGATEEKICKDSEGRECFESVWGGKEWH